jgi:hypothetical protein
VASPKECLVRGSYLNNPCRDEDYDPPTWEEEQRYRLKLGIRSALERVTDDVSAEEIRKFTEELERCGLVVCTKEEQMCMHLGAEYIERNWERFDWLVRGLQIVVAKMRWLVRAHPVDPYQAPAIVIVEQAQQLLTYLAPGLLQLEPFCECDGVDGSGEAPGHTPWCAVTKARRQQ